MGNLLAIPSVGLAVIGWSGLVTALVLLHRFGAGDSKLAAWPGYWLGALALALLPALAVPLVSLFPALGPVLAFEWATGFAETLFGSRDAELPVAATWTLDHRLPVPGPEGSGSPYSVVLAQYLPAALAAALVAYGAGLAFFGGRLALGRARVSRLLARAAHGQSCHGGWPLLLSDEATTPFAWGNRRDGVIVLPRHFAETLDAARLDGIIRHEAAHLRRGDTVTGTALAVIGTVFWFNPFIHMLIARWHLAAELACDASALDGAGPATRKAYAQTLVDALRLPGRALPCPAAAFSTSRLKDEKMRLNNILKGNSLAVVGTREKLMLGACAAMLGLAGCAGAAKMTPEPEETTQAVFIAAPDADGETLAWVAEGAGETSWTMDNGSAWVADERPHDMMFVGNDGTSGNDDFRTIVTWENGVRTERRWEDLTPEEQQQIRDDLAKAEEDMAQARLDMEQAKLDIEQARVDIETEMARFSEMQDGDWPISDEERARIREEVKREMENARRELEQAREEMDRGRAELDRQREELREQRRELAKREARPAAETEE